MGTGSLIANGCMFTILDQFFTASSPSATDDTAKMKINNVASQLARIAQSLEEITGLLKGEGAEPQAQAKQAVTNEEQA